MRTIPIALMVLGVIGGHGATCATVESAQAFTSQLVEQLGLSTAAGILDRRNCVERLVPHCQFRQ